ncbi:MAG: hypothetical protein RL708_350 [Bacteroidota bacterium]
MKQTLLIFATIFTLFVANANAQTYTTTTESKHCGACGHEVSIYSHAGMTCPYCGAHWGSENTSTSYSTATNYSSNYYNNSTPSGYISSNANLRQSASFYGNILTVMQGGTFVRVINTYGDWCYVEYTYFNGYYNDTIKGYVHRSLII